MGVSAALAVARLLVTLVIVGMGVLTVVRVVGLDRSFPLVPFMTVYPYVVVVTGVSAVIALGLGARWPALVAGVLVLVGLVVLAPRVLPSSGPDPAPEGPTVTLAAANLRVGQADPAALAAMLEQLDVDLLVTTELTGPAIDGLAAAGLDDRFPHQVLRPSARTSGGGIYSRWPLERGPDNPRGGFGATPSARIDVPGAPPVDLLGVHPLPPTNRAWTISWRADLRTLPGPVEDRVRLLAGDFNATLDHSAFREVLGRGYLDAAATRGQGWRPTFSGFPFGDPVPPVTLDHVVVDQRVAVEDVVVRDIDGSDHRMIVARLRLPQG